jgi:hypothetical protein
MPDALTRGQLDRSRVSEPADTAQRSEIVIERAVLLHHDDDVLDVMDGAGLVIGRNGQSAGNACRRSGGCRSGGQELQEVTTVCAHAEFPSVAIAGGSLAAVHRAGVMIWLRLCDLLVEPDFNFRVLA